MMLRYTNRAFFFARRFFFEARYVSVHSAVSKSVAYIFSPKTRSESIHEPVSIDDLLRSSNSEKTLVSPTGNSPVTTEKGPNGRVIYSLNSARPRSVLKNNTVIILTDTQIEQCLLYRVYQRSDALRRAGFNPIILRTGEIGRLFSYVKMASVVVIYRTPLSTEYVDQIANSGTKFLFEIDDMVLGSALLNKSEITASLNLTQRLNISAEAEAMYQTAKRADALIVSTSTLKKQISEQFQADGIADRKISIVPNFPISKRPHTIAKKEFLFAFTTPSASTAPEVALFLKAIHSFARFHPEDFKILIIGNDAAHKEIAIKKPKNCSITFLGFRPYKEYISLISRVKYVLIPLNDVQFNRCKTLIRAFDCYVAGCIPLCSPVGEYEILRKNTKLSNLLIEQDGWENLDDRVSTIEPIYEDIFSRFSSFIESEYSESVAVESIKEAFN
jgi:hypothetical protein